MYSRHSCTGVGVVGIYVGYSIVYDLAGIVISNRTYSASDGDTSGYSDIWDY